MKKLLALLLAVLMLLSCTAMAATEVNPLLDGRPQIAFDVEKDTDNSELDIKDDQTSRFIEEDGKSGTVQTELWLEVENSGQIDVTVPLILVFSTNVDGGKATAAENYKIYNNNERNSIAVDKISVVDEAGSQMTFLSEGAFDTQAAKPDSRDYYSVILEPVEADAKYFETNTSENQSALGSLDMKTKVNTDHYDLFFAQAGTNAYDTTGEDKTHESLMTLGQGGIINLKPTMETTPLSFVTQQYKGDSNDATHGVKLLTVTYTVGLQYTNGVGKAITNGDHANS